MKHSMHWRVICICGALSVVSAVVWAAPAITTGVRTKPTILVVGQSAKTRVNAAPNDLKTLKVVALNNQEKAKLFETAGFAVPNGIVTKAKFTPGQPIIAKQGLINITDAYYWASGSPTDSSDTGHARMQGGKGCIDLGFIPFVANKPVLVVFNIWTQTTAFDLLAGEQTQKLTLQSGDHNIACIVTPTTTDMQWVTLQCTLGYEWQFESVEVIVQQ